jgi:hypothetical protein
MYNAGFKKWVATIENKPVRLKAAAIEVGNTVYIENGWRVIKGKVTNITRRGREAEVEYMFENEKKNDVFSVNHLKKVYGRENAYTD